MAWRIGTSAHVKRWRTVLQTGARHCRCYHAWMFCHAFAYRGRDFAVHQTAEGELALMLGKVVRKQCPPSDREPQYLWTNVELEWEEHHYIEVRYWATSGRLRITANGQPLHDDAVARAG